MRSNKGRPRRKKKSAKKNVFPHTQAKLNLYKGYLARYLSVLINASFVKEIHIHDLFCGQGKYDDGRYGSPIIAYNVIKDIFESSILRSNFTGINLTVNDQDADKISNVQTLLKELENPDLDLLNVSYFNLDAEQILDKVITQIRHQKYGARNLILLDPYGYKSIKKRQLKTLLHTGKAEVILFLPVSNMYRFSETAMISELNHFQELRQFIESFFPESHLICLEGGVKDVHEYITFLTDAFSFNGKFFADSYYLERGAGIFYSMFFITKHIYGMDKFLETKWQLDPARGQGYKAETVTLDMFIEHFKTIAYQKTIGTYKSKLIEFLTLNGNLNNIELYEFSIRNKMLSKHTNLILRELQEKGALEVWDIEKKKVAKKNSFYLSYKHYKNGEPKVAYKYEEIVASQRHRQHKSNQIRLFN